MVFTKETMAASSARGQKAMGKNSVENANPRPPLDQNAVQAIVCEFASMNKTHIPFILLSFSAIWQSCQQHNKAIDILTFFLQPHPMSMQLTLKKKLKIDSMFT